MIGLGQIVGSLTADFTAAAHDNRACLRRTKLPCAFIQGTADATVPPADARSCYEACAGPKAWLEVEGAAHTLCFPVGGDALRRRLADFLNPFLDEKLQ